MASSIKETAKRDAHIQRLPVLICIKETCQVLARQKWNFLVFFLGWVAVCFAGFWIASIYDPAVLLAQDRISIIFLVAFFIFIVMPFMFYAWFGCLFEERHFFSLFPFKIWFEKRFWRLLLWHFVFVGGGMLLLIPIALIVVYAFITGAGDAIIIAPALLTSVAVYLYFIRLFAWMPMLFCGEKRFFSKSLAVTKGNTLRLLCYYMIVAFLLRFLTILISISVAFPIAYLQRHTVNFLETGYFLSLFVSMIYVPTFMTVASVGITVAYKHLVAKNTVKNVVSLRKTKKSEVK